MDKIEIMARGVENKRRASIGLPSKSSPLISAQVVADMKTAKQALEDAGFVIVPKVPTEANPDYHYIDCFRLLGQGGDKADQAKRLAAYVADEVTAMIAAGEGA